MLPENVYDLSSQQAAEVAAMLLHSLRREVEHFREYRKKRIPDV